MKIKLSPSGSDRWLGDGSGEPCPGAPRLCATTPSPKATDVMVEGTAAHYVGEQCLLKNRDPRDYLGKKVNVQGDYSDPEDIRRILVTEEMIAAVMVYLEKIQLKRQQAVNGAFKVEEPLDLTWLVPGLKGTADHLIIEMFGRLWLDDYKHGAGKYVKADCPQIKIYSLAALGQGNPNMIGEVIAEITQPRVFGVTQEPAIYDPDDLYHWGETALKPAAQLALSADAPRVPTVENCRWCDGLAYCPEVREKVFAILKGKLLTKERLALCDPAKLGPESWAAIYEIAELVSPWVKAVKELMTMYLEANGPAFNLEFKPGRLSRKWRDEQKAVDTVKENWPKVATHEPPKAKTVAKMEAALKASGVDLKTVKAAFEPLVELRRGKKIVRTGAVDETTRALVNQYFGDFEDGK